MVIHNGCAADAAQRQLQVEFVTTHLYFLDIIILNQNYAKETQKESIRYQRQEILLRESLFKL